MILKEIKMKTQMEMSTKMEMKTWMKTKIRMEMKTQMKMSTKMQIIIKLMKIPIKLHLDNKIKNKSKMDKEISQFLHWPKCQFSFPQVWTVPQHWAICLVFRPWTHQMFNLCKMCKMEEITPMSMLMQTLSIIPVKMSL